MSEQVRPLITSDLFSIREAADYMRVNPATIRRRIASGELHAHRFGKRLIRVEKAQLDGMLQPVPTDVA